MVHSDDEGLVLPPRVAPVVAAIVPIYKTDEERAKVAAFIEKIVTALVGAEEVARAAGRTAGGELASFFFDRSTHQKIVVDWRDNRPGDKHFHWEQRGVPFRIEVGPRDVDANAFVLKHRIVREKETVALGDANSAWLRAKLDAVQSALLAACAHDAGRKHAACVELRRAEAHPGNSGRLRAMLVRARSRGRSTHQGRDQGDRARHSLRPAERQRHLRALRA